MNKRIQKRFLREHGSRRPSVAAGSKTRGLFVGEMMQCIFCHHEQKHPGKGIGCGWLGIELTPSLERFYACPGCIYAVEQQVQPGAKAQGVFMAAVTLAQSGKAEEIPALFSESKPRVVIQ